MAALFRWACFRRLFPTPRRQTADEHKRDQDGAKDSQLQDVRGMSFKICRGIDGDHFAVTHRTAFAVKCGYLLPEVFHNARREP
jgi:hypothetical protein